MAKTTIMKLEDIRVPDAFRRSRPKEGKVGQKVEEHRDAGRFRRPVVVTPDGLLVDGYVTYLAAMELGLDEISALVRDRYAVVTGYHIGNEGRPYQWRSSHRAPEDFEPGEHLAVRTSRGVQEIVVTGARWEPAESVIGMSSVIGKWDSIVEERRGGQP